MSSLSAILLFLSNGWMANAVSLHATHWIQVASVMESNRLVLFLCLTSNLKHHLCLVWSKNLEKCISIIHWTNVAPNNAYLNPSGTAVASGDYVLSMQWLSQWIVVSSKGMGDSWCNHLICMWSRSSLLRHRIYHCPQGWICSTRITATCLSICWLNWL